MIDFFLKIENFETFDRGGPGSLSGRGTKKSFIS